MANPNGPPPEARVATQFKKGNPGGGRPRRPVTEAYQRKFEEKLPVEYLKPLGLKAGATWLDAVVQQHFRTMLKTNEVAVSARREASDRVEGKPAQRFEVHQAAEVEFHLVYEEPIGVKRRIQDEPIDVKPELPPSAPADDETP